MAESEITELEVVASDCGIFLRSPSKRRHDRSEALDKLTADPIVVTLGKHREKTVVVGEKRSGYDLEGNSHVVRLSF